MSASSEKIDQTAMGNIIGRLEDTLRVNLATD